MEDDAQREGQKGAGNILSPQEKHHQMQQIKSIIREVDRNGDGEVRCVGSEPAPVDQT